MSFYDAFKKRKQEAFELSKVLGREVSPKEIQIKKSGPDGTLTLYFLKSEEEYMLADAYLKSQSQNIGYKITDATPEMEAEADAFIAELSGQKAH
jgi:hypothetical protein